mmetsp:Transcript_22244/g.33145  ORF Transcript_22244/g.33145 Transcript_22244/m.33145 type:complete len:89 (+) Transcript_22244:378-644(+)
MDLVKSINISNHTNTSKFGFLEILIFFSKTSSHSRALWERQTTPPRQGKNQRNHRSCQERDEEKDDCEMIVLSSKTYSCSYAHVITVL